MKKILILLSTYNGEKYLNKQLDSIYKQKTTTEIHMLVRDDGSNDDTINILKKWKKKLNIEIISNNQKNMGPAMSFWYLLKQVREADYYAFVDQDDYWLDNKIETAINELNKSNVPTLWFSNYNLMDGNGTLIMNNYNKTPPILTIVSQIICGSAQGCSMIFNKQAYDYINKINIKYIPMHDIVLMICLLAKGKVIYCDNPLFNYRVHASNVVAKRGKSFHKKIESTMKSWFGNNKYYCSNLAKMVLDNFSEELSEEELSYLKELIKCKHSLLSRYRIINNILTNTTNKKALRSFKIRVFLGIV